jgi:hypothetical protein
MAEYKPVVFNEGAPLDPQKLNDMQTNISNLVGDVGGLKNTTLDSTYTLLTDAGSFMTGDLTANSKNNQGEVAYSASFTGVPRIVASIGSSIGVGDIVTVSIEDGATKPSINVHTNKNRGPVRINWMAFQKKQ